MSTITKEQEAAIAEFLEGKHIPSGLGDEHEACSVAAINLALTGNLTDDIPNCMSTVIGKWIIRIQDAMPDDLRNSIEWRTLLPLAAGTGRQRETERLALILDWMWTVVLPELQPLADEQGFGSEWESMTDNKSQKAATDAADAADAAYDAATAAYAAAYTTAAYAATDAATAYAATDAATAAAYDAAHAAATAATAAAAYTTAAYAATDAAHAAATAATAATVAFWVNVNPAGLLKALVEVN